MIDDKLMDEINEAAARGKDSLSPEEAKRSWRSAIPGRKVEMWRNYREAVRQQLESEAK